MKEVSRKRHHRPKSQWSICFTIFSSLLFLYEKILSYAKIQGLQGTGFFYFFSVEFSRPLFPRMTLLVQVRGGGASSLFITLFVFDLILCHALSDRSMANEDFVSIFCYVSSLRLVPSVAPLSLKDTLYRMKYNLHTTVVVQYTAKTWIMSNWTSVYGTSQNHLD